MRDTADNLGLRVRQVLRESTLPGLARDYARHVREGEWYLRLWWIASVAGMVLLIVLIPWVLCRVVCAQADPEQLLAFLAALLTISTFEFAAELKKRLHTSSLLYYGACLPVADADFARYIWRPGLVAGAGIAYLSAWIGVFTADLRNWGAAAIALALLIGLLQGALYLSLGTWLALLWPDFPWRWATRAGRPLLCAYFFVLWAEVPGAAHASAPILLATPAGWVNSQLVYGYVQGRWGVALGLIPCGIILALGRRAYRRLVETYRIREVVLRRSGQAQVVTEADFPLHNYAESRLWAALTNRVDELSIDDVDAVADEQAIARIRSRAFLGDGPRAQESLAARGERLWLAPREKPIFDFLTNDSDTWPRVWWGLAILTAIAVAADLVVSRLALTRPEGAAPFYVAFVILCLYSILSGPWLGMSGEGPGKISVPRFALVPIRFGEISRVMFKVASARLLMFGPFAMIACWLLARVFRRADTAGRLTWTVLAIPFAAAACLALFALVAQGCLIGWKFYGATVYRRIAGRSAPWFLAVFAFSPIGTFLLGMLWFPAMGWLSVHFPEGWLYLLATVPAFCAWSAGVWLMIRKAYQANLVDLMASASTNNWSSSSGSLELSEAKSRRRRALRRRYGWLWRLRKPRGAAA